jgi:Glucose-6-phosphate 1-dehydrogenase
MQVAAMPNYLGKRPQGDWVLFALPVSPTKETHDHFNTSAQGPFRTRLAAAWFNRYGWGNPHVHTVGDASLFTRSDGIESSWQVIDPVLQGWEKQNTPPLTIYERGEWGPAGSDELLARAGHAWRFGCLD